MKGLCKKAITLFILAIVLFAVALPVYAANDADAEPQTAVTQEAESEEATTEEDNSLGDKALAVGLAITFAAGLGGLGMGIATGKAAEGISRQPEAEGKIRTTFMLGLVFIETAIIYALLAVILIIFVL